MFLYWRKVDNRYFLYLEKRWKEEGRVKSKGISLGEHPFQKLKELDIPEGDITKMVERLKPPPGPTGNTDFMVVMYLKNLRSMWETTENRVERNVIEKCAYKFAILFNQLKLYLELGFIERNDCL